MQPARVATSGRVVWNINSTTRGGGVAELLGALLPYQRGVGIDARWVAIDGTPAFFELTKKLYTLLHGASPDGISTSPADRRLYESRRAENAAALLEMIRPDDVVILHDPQTAGLAPALARHGCTVIWRCHIGVDEPDETVRRGWSFLRPYLSAAQALIFTRRTYVWDGLDPARVEIIPPSLDAFTPKNEDIDHGMVAAILQASGLVKSTSRAPAAAFVRKDGSTGQAVTRLLRDPGARRSLGSQARRRVGRKFLAPSELIEQANLLRRVTAHVSVR